LIFFFSYKNSFHINSFFFQLGYYRLLKGKCEIEQQELQTATINLIHQIKQGSYTTTIQNEELKNLLEKIYELNRRLIKHTDIKTQAILEKEWNDLQKSIHEIDINIKQKCDTLVTVSVSDSLVPCNARECRDINLPNCLENIAVRLVLMSSEKVCFDFIFRLSIIEFWAI